MSARRFRLMLAVLAAPIALIGAVIGSARAAEAAPDRYGAPVYAPSDAVDAAPALYLNWPGKTPAAPSARVAAPFPAAASAPVTLAGGPPPLQAVAPAKIYEKAASPTLSRSRIQTSARADQVAHLLRQSESIGSPRHVVRRARVASRTHTGHGGRIIRVAQVAPEPLLSAAVQPAPATADAIPSNPRPAAIAANSLPPHFYSVQRPFGVKPDPIPLPAQFFADSAPTDLAAPPPPLPPRVILGQGASSTASVQRAVAAANLAAGDANTSN